MEYEPRVDSAFSELVSSLNEARPFVLDAE